ncbi:MAG TPA: carboxypeptidase-like regulatory domain-containing protein [Cyclobacteriaceae bacterium]|nr:carboxypeptidase-like regulatory domain-containing protein [Cyclobacteriaceae bacterium]
MKHNLRSLPFLILLLILAGCDGNNPKPNSGDIIGTVKIEDENQLILQDRSGVKVEITNNYNSFSTITNSTGEFNFEDTPFGIYELKLSKEGYMDLNKYDQTTLDPVPNEFSHTGDSLPTRLNDNIIFQIPEFEFHLDSARYVPELDYTDVLIFGPPPNDDVTPVYGYYPLFCFFNTGPDVSKDEFIFYKFGFMSFFRRYPEWDPPLIEIEWVSELENTEADSVFICVYTVSRSENEFLPLHFEALGKPSNILGFPIK